MHLVFFLLFRTASHETSEQKCTEILIVFRFENAPLTLASNWVSFSLSFLVWKKEKDFLRYTNWVIKMDLFAAKRQGGDEIVGMFVFADI